MEKKGKDKVEQKKSTIYIHYLSLGNNYFTHIDTQP